MHSYSTVSCRLGNTPSNIFSIFIWNCFEKTVVRQKWKDIICVFFWIWLCELFMKVGISNVDLVFGLLSKRKKKKEKLFFFFADTWRTLTVSVFIFFIIFLFKKICVFFLSFSHMCKFWIINLIWDKEKDVVSTMCNNSVIY